MSVWRKSSPLKRDGGGPGFAGFGGELLGEFRGFRVFDVEAHILSFPMVIRLFLYY